MVSFKFLLCSALLLASAIAAPRPEAEEPAPGTVKKDIAEAAENGDHVGAEYVT